MILDYLIIIVVIILIIFLFSIYNKLVLLKDKVNESWQQLDDIFKLNHKTMLNIITIAKDKYKLSKNDFKEIIDIIDKIEEEKELENKIKCQFKFDLLANEFLNTVENNKLLKDKEILTFKKYFLENNKKIEFLKTLYNELASKYNNKLHSFPIIIVAKIFDFDDECLYEEEY